MSHWRDHPRLKGRFDHEFPDDIEVLVHDGGPWFTQHNPEIVWVRVTGGSGYLFTGTILHQPEEIDAASEGSVIMFMAVDGGPHPVMVSERYLKERSDWIIDPCKRCGFTEILDTPSELRRVAGPAKEAIACACAFCGGQQILRPKRHKAPVTTVPQFTSMFEILA